MMCRLTVQREFLTLALPISAKPLFPVAINVQTNITKQLVKTFKQLTNYFSPEGTVKAV